MANKRKPAKKTTRRKGSRVSGLVSKDLFEKAAGAIAGYVGARMLTAKVLPNLDAKIKGAATAAVGLLLIPKVLKNKLGEGMALGFAVAGGETLLQSTGLIAGIGAIQYLPYPQRMIAGAGINQTVGGSDGISQTVGGSDGISQTVGYSRSYNRRRAEA